MNNTNNFSARESFAHAKRMFYLAFRDKFTNDRDCMEWVEALKLSQSEIRLECELNALSTQFIFGVTPNQVNNVNFQFNTERRLQLQDSLCVNEYGFFVGNPASRIDTTWNLRTYGNQVDFTAAQAAAINSTLYSHGWFELRCNNDVIMPYRPLFNHLYKPQTQETAALGAGAPDDQVRGAEDGFITDEPNIVFIGSKGYVPSVNIPVALAAAAGFERGVLMLRGILAQNSTVVS